MEYAPRMLQPAKLSNWDKSLQAVFAGAPSRLGTNERTFRLLPKFPLQNH